MIAAIATDLDGTLLNKEGSISDYTAGTLLKLSSSGIKIILASGRSLNEIKCLDKSLPEKFHVAAYNGSVVAEFEKGKFTTYNVISLKNETLLSVIKILDSFQMPFFVSEGDKSFVPTQEVENLFKKEGLPDIFYLEDFTSLKNSLKIAIPVYLSGRENIESVKKSVLDAMTSIDFVEHGLQIVSSNEWLDIIPLKAGKSQGLRHICKKLDISMDQIVSFGDGGNDLCMLKSTGRSIAPLNGCLAAKQAAQSISKWSNDEDCVAKELRNIFSDLF